MAEADPDPAAGNAVPAADPPAVPGPDISNDENVVLPFSGPTNSAWEASALSEAKEKASRKTLRLLNGQRVTVWRICVEKKRKQMAAIFGLGFGQGMAEFPEDCRRKVVEFLPADPSPPPGDAVMDAAEWKLLKAKRLEEILQKWTHILTQQIRQRAVSVAWGNMRFRKAAINEDNAPGTLDSVQNGQWWTVTEFHEKLRSLGYAVQAIPEEEARNSEAGNNPWVFRMKPREGD